MDNVSVEKEKYIEFPPKWKPQLPGIDPLNEIFTPHIAQNLNTPLPGTTLLGRIERLLKRNHECIRDDTDLGKRVLWSMNYKLPGTSSVGRALRVIRQILERQKEIDEQEKLEK
jgi:hypothetical protein